MNTRIYVVRVKTGDKTQVKLVDAATQSQALRHVAKSFMEVKVASAKDVADYLGKGAKVETAKVEDNGAPEAEA
jgi:hypothetical protein